MRRADRGGRQHRDAAEPHDFSGSPLDQALALLDRGFALLPVRRDKTPNLQVLRRVHGRGEWLMLRDRPASRPEVTAWFEADPNTGVGIITGEVSGIAVRDFDCGLPDRLPATPVVETPGRGGHVYFSIDGPVRTRRLDDGELRANGGYVVAPPSLHPNGGRYRWLVGLSVPLAPLERDDPLTDSPHEKPAAVGAPRHTYRGALVHALTGERVLEDWCRDPQWVCRAAEQLGASAHRGFKCILPGHEESRPSANIWRDPTGLFVYRCHHHRGPRQLILPDVYATRVSGRWRKRNGPELARWQRRFVAATGDIQPVSLDVPRLPGLSDDERRVLAGFALLLGLRLAAGDNDPAPFTRRFGSEWCAMPERRFERAKGELIRRRLLVKVGECASGYTNTASLYVLAGLET